MSLIYIVTIDCVFIWTVIDVIYLFNQILAGFMKKEMRITENHQSVIDMQAKHEENPNQNYKTFQNFKPQCKTSQTKHPVRTKFRDCQQITFVTLNGFCPLRKKKKKKPSPLFLTDNIKMDKIPTKIKWKIDLKF